jgi:hypothetical protein
VSAVEQRSQEELSSVKKAGFVAWLGDRRSTHMPVDRERGIIDPEGWTAERGRSANDPAQLGDAHQTALEAASDHLEVQLTGNAQKRPLFNEADAGDVLRSLWVLGPEEDAISRAQASIPGVHLRSSRIKRSVSSRP